MSNAEQIKILVEFLGGDTEAVKIAHALAREAILTVDRLREERALKQTVARDNGQGGWDTYEVPYLLDIRMIGPSRLARIDAALAGELP